MQLHLHVLRKADAATSCWYASTSCCHRPAELCWLASTTATRSTTAWMVTMQRRRRRGSVSGGRAFVKQDTSAGRVRAAGKANSPPCPGLGPSQRLAGAHARLADLIESAAAARSRHIVVISASVRERWMRRRARASASRRPRRARGRISRRGGLVPLFILGSVRCNHEKRLVFINKSDTQCRSDTLGASLPKAINLYQ